MWGQTRGLSVHGPLGRWWEVREAPMCTHLTFHHGHRACRSPLPQRACLPQTCFYRLGGHPCPYPFESPVCHSYCILVYAQAVGLTLSTLPVEPWLPPPRLGTQEKDNGLQLEIHERELLGSYLIHRKYLSLCIRSHDFRNLDSI